MASFGTMAKDSTLPFVSIVVPVRNGARTISDCLASLQRTDYPADRREILVSDDGSTDRTREIIRRFSVRYLRADGRGPGAARNKGIEASRGEIVAFTDADCLVTHGWIRALVEGFQNETVGGVEGETVDYLPVTPAEKYRAMRGSFHYQVRRGSPLAPYVVTANAAFRREVFERIGLFDVRLPAGEDVDFSWRFFQKTDLKLHYNPHAVVFHRHRTTAMAFLAQQVRNGRGLAMLCAKYPERLPWSWGQEARAWGALVKFAKDAATATAHYSLRRGDKMDAYYAGFTLLGKLGTRIGFIWGTFDGGGRR